MPASFFNDLKSTLLSKILGLKINLNYNIREANRPEKILVKKETFYESI